MDDSGETREENPQLISVALFARKDSTPPSPRRTRRTKPCKKFGMRRATRANFQASRAINISSRL